MKLNLLGFDFSGDLTVRFGSAFPIYFSNKAYDSRTDIESHLKSAKCHSLNAVCKNVVMPKGESIFESVNSKLSLKVWPK